MSASRVRGRATFNIGSVLSRSFSIWGRNIIPFLILSVIIYMPLFIFLVAARPAPPSYYYGEGAMGRDTSSIWFYALGSMVLMIVLQYVVQGALIYGVFQQLRGEPAKMGDCVRVGFGRLLPVIGVGVLAGLATVLGVIALIVPGIIIACMYWVAVPVAVVEKPGVVASLSRSASLTSGQKWSVFAVLLILFVVQQAAEKVFERILSGEGTLGVIVGLIPTIALGMLGAVASAVGYHDLRVAKEGVGIEDLVRVFS